MSANRYQYSAAQVTEALCSLGIGNDSLVFFHLSLGRLGFSDRGNDALSAAQTVLDGLRATVGTHGTLMTPSYTYSLGRGEVFDTASTPSTVGFFSEYVRTLPDWKRSREPMLAVSGSGPATATLFRHLPATCYGIDSIYDRLCAAGAWIVTMGLGLHWATFRHHIEECAGVPFRQIKSFTARIREPDGQLSEETWRYFAAPFLDACAPDGNRLANILSGNGHLQQARLGMGEITAIPAATYRAQALPLLEADPWLCARGPACSHQTILRHMDHA